PGGALSYGWKSTLPGTLNLFPIHGFEAHPNGGQLDYWIRVFGGAASVYHSPGSSTVYTDGGQGVFPPGTIMFGPGYDNDPDNFGVIRLTVPPGNAGTY